ncbi:Beta-lactamase enzyme family protein [Bosea sp. OK403]|uniref:serine hydrolase n=1 Tax=Bosea sp. OK403 TaxID=1855286 RepID=UPI0008EAF862|nr:serine hydrolase [Bosea sp. OK403]SFJ70652.1 Beta-lactamase enzyme family protein [Bosea sp. OK403]
MSFFDDDPVLQGIGTLLAEKAHATFRERGVPPEQFGYVLLQPGRDGGRPRGAALNAGWRSYPCSLVKVFFLVAAQAALEEGRLQPHEELERAMRDMILWSSNAATNYIIDLLSGTTGDTLLTDAEMAAWSGRRQSVNRYFAALDWPELDGINLDQKLMDDLRYGREKIGLDQSPIGHNVLTPIAMARLMYEIFHGSLLGETCRPVIRDLLARNLESPFVQRGAYQVSGYLAGGMPAGTQVWSKAGRTRWLGDERAEFRRHDALRSILPNGEALIAVVFTQGEAIAEDDGFFPSLGALIAEQIVRRDVGHSVRQR